MNLHLRPATDQDKSFLRHLNEEAYKAVVGEQFGVWDDRIQEEHFENKWKTEQYQIVEKNGRRIGAIWMTRESDHIWLREIQVSSEHRNLGIGTDLILGMIDDARALNLPLRLRVLTVNRAKRLYERLGFRTTGMFEDTHYWMEHTP